MEYNSHTIQEAEMKHSETNESNLVHRRTHQNSSAFEKDYKELDVIHAILGTDLEQTEIEKSGMMPKMADNDNTANEQLFTDNKSSQGECDVNEDNELNKDSCEMTELSACGHLDFGDICNLASEENKFESDSKDFIQLSSSHTNMKDEVQNFPFDSEIELLTLSDDTYIETDACFNASKGSVLPDFEKLKLDQETDYSDAEMQPVLVHSGLSNNYGISDQLADENGVKIGLDERLPKSDSNIETNDAIDHITIVSGWNDSEKESAFDAVDSVHNITDGKKCQNRDTGLESVEMFELPSSHFKVCQKKHLKSTQIDITEWHPLSMSPCSGHAIEKPKKIVERKSDNDLTHSVVDCDKNAKTEVETSIEGKSSVNGTLNFDCKKSFNSILGIDANSEIKEKYSDIFNSSLKEELTCDITDNGNALDHDHCASLAGSKTNIDNVSDETTDCLSGREACFVVLSTLLVIMCIELYSSSTKHTRARENDLWESTDDLGLELLFQEKNKDQRIRNPRQFNSSRGKAARKRKKQQRKLITMTTKKNKNIFAETLEDLRPSWYHDASILTDVDHSLTCSVCLEMYYLPSVCQPCGHIFCDPCLRRLTRGQGAEGILCPLCRTVIGSCSLDKEFNEQLMMSHPDVYYARHSAEKKSKYRHFMLPFTPPVPLSKRLLRHLVTNRTNIPMTNLQMASISMSRGTLLSCSKLLVGCLAGACMSVLIMFFCHVKGAHSARDVNIMFLSFLAGAFVTIVVNKMMRV